MKLLVQNGIVKYHPNWPVEPAYGVTRDLPTTYRNRELEDKYNQALEQAKLEALPVEDQEWVKREIFNVYEPEKCTLTWCIGKSKIPGTNGCFNQCARYNTIEDGGFYEVDLKGRFDKVKFKWGYYSIILYRFIPEP